MSSTTSSPAQPVPLSPVLQHAAFFEDEKHQLTVKSMQKGHERLYIHDVRGVSIKIQAILNIMKIKKHAACPLSIASYVNPARSGLWDEKGTFDEKAFETLAARAQKSENGKVEFVTRPIMDQFIKDRGGGKMSSGVATWVWVLEFFYLPVFWAAVTEGSFNEMFQYLADHWYLDPKEGVYKPALTLPLLRMWYTDPNRVFKRRELGQLPALKPIDRPASKKSAFKPLFSTTELTLALLLCIMVSFICMFQETIRRVWFA